MILNVNPKFNPLILNEMMSCFIVWDVCVCVFVCVCSQWTVEGGGELKWGAGLPTTAQSPDTKYATVFADTYITVSSRVFLMSFISWEWSYTLTRLNSSACLLVVIFVSHRNLQWSSFIGHFVYLVGGDGVKGMYLYMGYHYFSQLRSSLY